MPRRPHLSSRMSSHAALVGGAATLALLLAPVGAGAQDRAAQGGGAEKNVTAEVQNEISVNLPSLNPLVQRVQPAVVNISAQITTEASSGSDRSADTWSQQSHRIYVGQGSVTLPAWPADR